MNGNGGGDLTGDHKAQLLSDLIHAAVVVIVVITTAVLYVSSGMIPTDITATVFGSAIGYAAGRAGTVARTRRNEGQ